MIFFLNLAVKELKKTSYNIVCGTENKFTYLGEMLQDQGSTAHNKWSREVFTSTGFRLIEKINATAPQLQRTVIKYFAIFKNIADSLEPGETPTYSASHRAPNYVQRS